MSEKTSIEKLTGIYNEYLVKKQSQPAMTFSEYLTHHYYQAHDWYDKLIGECGISGLNELRDALRKVSVIETPTFIHHEPKFKIGDKAYKPKGYKFPCTIVSIFYTTSGEVRIVGEMDDYGMLHIFNESQLELV